MERSCPSGEQLQRWYDRELPRDQRLPIARHARACAACRDVVRGFALARRAVRSLPMPSATSIAFARARDEFRRMRQVELIGWLRRATAAAAAVLIVSLVAPAVLSSSARTGVSGDPNGAADPASVNQPADASLTPGHSVAQWIVRDLSQG